MKKLVLFIFLLLNAFIIKAQEDVTIMSNYDKTYIPATTNSYGRFEIIQSNMLAMQTFKIDKISGFICNLAMREDSTYTWDPVEVEQSKYNVKKPNVINYQLYISGIAARYCFLLNINNGLTWQLKKDDNGKFCFEILK